MDSRRQQKVASLIQEAFGEILARMGKGIYGKAFVTITNVKVTPDLSEVRFYLSVFNAEDKAGVIEQIKGHEFELKRELSAKLRHHLRKIPVLEFFLDDSLDQAYHMEEVFKRIKKENE
ncbi:MAG: 30S ribosome-binding factor RbfA [Chitinophagales bacterium]